jgi:hypothetical protein
MGRIFEKRIVNGEEYVVYKNGRLVPLRVHEERRKNLRAGQAKGVEAKKQLLTMRKVKDHFQQYLEDGGVSWLHSQVPDNILAECGLQKGTKFVWIAALRMKLSEAAIFEKNAASARFLLDLEKFLYTQNKDKAIEVKEVMTDNFGDML